MNRRDFLKTTATSATMLPLVGSAGSARAAEETKVPGAWTPAHLDASRVWLGPELWANPLQDWAVADGAIVSRGGVGRNVQILTRTLSERTEAFSATLTVRCRRPGPKPAAAQAGFWVGIQGNIDDFRHRLIFPLDQIRCGVAGDGRLFIDDTTQLLGFDPTADETVELELTGAPADDGFRLELKATVDSRTSTVTARYPAERLKGNLGIFAETGKVERGRKGSPSWELRNWRVDGPKLDCFPERAFGPILWSTYTLDQDRGLKLSTMIAVVGEDDSGSVRLEFEQDGRWIVAAKAKIDPLARIAAFALPRWPVDRAGRYRIAYDWDGSTHTWEGGIRPAPTDHRKLRMAVINCDNGYAFPLPTLARQVLDRDPDLMFFAGDQIYEKYGGFGVYRGRDVELAMLDYLRKYYQCGWTWRELWRSRPTIIIPDDHDVFHGNLWGAAGRSLHSGEPQTDGGYIMPSAWVNAVQRTQIAHLPDPIDPNPTGDGIGVYFTSLRYGGVSFAILEDRKWKPGPGDSSTRLGEHATVEELRSVPGDILGARQEAFLQTWTQDWRHADFKVVLSQTVFGQGTTHSGANMVYLPVDWDSNAGPVAARDRALDLIRRGFAFMVCGDQHLGMLAGLGIEEAGDAGTALVVTGSAVGFTRAYWPEVTKHADATSADYERVAGTRTNAWGEPMNVRAVSNPEPAFLLAGGTGNPAGPDDVIDRARRRASGYGWVEFDRDTVRIRAELARLPRRSETIEVFPGFPQEITLFQNYGRKGVAKLPELMVSGTQRPVLQVIAERNGEVIYTVRIPTKGFSPKVFTADTSYTLKVGFPERDVWQTFTGVVPVAPSAKSSLRVDFG